MRTAISCLVILSACWTALLAAPAILPKEPKVIVPILKQINQINDDGSYTFGYENGDGSFRVETKDVNGYIRGKYGYIDLEGRMQTLEYEAGKTSGKSVGFIPSGGLSPFPVVRNVVSTAEQKALDFEYSSVDEDEDGMPDNMPSAGPQQVRLATVESQQPVGRSGSSRTLFLHSGARESEEDLLGLSQQIHQGFGGRIRK